MRESPQLQSTFVVIVNLILANEIYIYKGVLGINPPALLFE